MDTHRQREIARKGGRAAHEKGKAHEFTPDEARAAGRKGGEKVSVNRRHMAEIGRRGGRSSAQRRRPGSNEGANGDGNGNGETNMNATSAQAVQQEQSNQEAADRAERDQSHQQQESNDNGSPTQAS